MTTIAWRKSASIAAHPGLPALSKAARALSGAAVLAGGCSVGELEITRGDGGASVAPDQLQLELAKAICSNVSGCCTEGRRPFEYGACEAAYLAQNPLVPIPDAGPYDAKAAHACVAALARSVRSCFRSPELAVCDQVSPLSHLILGERCNGTCYSVPELGGARVCTGSLLSKANRTCYADDGLFCDADGFCRKVGGIGAPCSQNEACKDSWCDGVSCVARGGFDTACTDTAECAGGLYCDGQSGACADKKVDGEPCESESACQSGACDGGRCAPFFQGFLQLVCVQ